MLTVDNILLALFFYMTSAYYNLCFMNYTEKVAKMNRKINKLNDKVKALKLQNKVNLIMEENDDTSLPDLVPLNQDENIVLSSNDVLNDASNEEEKNEEKRNEREQMQNEDDNTRRNSEDWVKEL